MLSKYKEGFGEHIIANLFLPITHFDIMQNKLKLSEILNE